MSAVNFAAKIHQLAFEISCLQKLITQRRQGVHDQPPFYGSLLS